MGEKHLKEDREFGLLGIDRLQSNSEIRGTYLMNRVRTTEPRTRMMIKIPTF